MHQCFASLMYTCYGPTTTFMRHGHHHQCIKVTICKEYYNGLTRYSFRPRRGSRSGTFKTLVNVGDAVGPQLSHTFIYGLNLDVVHLETRLERYLASSINALEQPRSPARDNCMATLFFGCHRVVISCLVFHKCGLLC